MSMIDEQIAALNPEERARFEEAMQVAAARLSYKPVRTKDGNDHWHKQPPSDLSRPYIPLAVTDPEGAHSPAPSTLKGFTIKAGAGGGAGGFTVKA